MTNDWLYRYHPSAKFLIWLYFVEQLAQISLHLTREKHTHTYIIVCLSPKEGNTWWRPEALTPQHHLRRWKVSMRHITDGVSLMDALIMDAASTKTFLSIYSCVANFALPEDTTLDLKMTIRLTCTHVLHVISCVGPVVEQKGSPWNSREISRILPAPPAERWGIPLTLAVE